MLCGRSAQQTVRRACWQCGSSSTAPLRTGLQRSYASASSGATPARSRAWPIYAVVIAGAGTAFATRQVLHADAPKMEDGEMVFEKKKKRRDPSKEANRDAISSQHVQVKQSWESPGVYAWGSNTGNVVNPSSPDNVVKNPRRVEFFDGKLLRDLKLDRGFGAAIDERGDLYLWGTAYSAKSQAPERILSGKKLRSLAISRDRVFALSSAGKVYSVPVSKEDQLEGQKPSESSWIPFWPSRSKVSYKIIDVPEMSWGETIKSVAAGLEHGLLLTTKGRLFSFASSSSSYPSRGQLGVPGITGWETRPAGPYDQPHQVATLKGFPISAVATGDFHSIVLDESGRVFGFGDNSSGQLGIDVTPESPYIDAASLVNTTKLYAGSAQIPRVTSIAAGGLVSFMTVEATRVASPNDDTQDVSSRAQVGRVTADTWSFGQGIYGTLGTGRWTHVQGEPVKIKALSGLYEYDEQDGRVVPIRMAHISVGSTHAAAVMDNVTHVGATARSSENDTNWGADVLWWGGNEHYQLGTGKRANSNVPTYIGPLDKIGDGSKRDEHRLHITPKKKIKVDGRSVEVEQRVECGRMASAVYSRVVE